jgi:hypothetical protein
MQTGFTFKNKHTSSFGLSVATKSRPVLPERRSSAFELPGNDGSIDYAYSNDYGRAMYQNRVFSVMMRISAEDIYDLQHKISRVAAWFMGSGELIFDDMPAVIWNADVIKEIDYAPELQGKKALLTVSFEIEPFSRAEFDVLGGIPLGTNIVIGSDVPLNIEQNFTYAASGTSAKITVSNIGTAWVRPVISISAPSRIDEWSVRRGERMISVKKYQESVSAFDLDLEKYTLRAGDGTSAQGLLSGQFFELEPGENTLEFTFGTSQIYTVTVSYVPRFIYDADIGGESFA